MKSRSFLAPLGLAGLLFSCQQANVVSPTGQGLINLDLSANSELKSSRKLADQEEVNPPDVKDFGVKITQGELLVQDWESYAACPPEVYLTPGEYQVHAWYGDCSEEGFEKAAYAGQTAFQLEDNEVKPVVVTATLVNTKADVKFTPSFRAYFSNFQARIYSQEDQPITFTDQEMRAAYFKPGTLRVELDMTTPQGESATLEVANLSETLPQTYYSFAMDVDAGEGSLIITFDSTTVKEPIKIDISDENLSTAAPVITPTGFTSGAELAHKGHYAFSEEDLGVSLASKGGFKSAKLTTTSAYLAEQGLPEIVDLVNLTPDERTLLAQLGLEVVGTEGEAKLVYLDLGALPTHIPFIEGASNTHHFELSAVARNGRIAENVALTFVTESNGFQVSQSPVKPYKGAEAMVDLSFIGDPQGVEFHYASAEGEVCVSEYIANQEGVHQFLLKGLPTTLAPVALQVYYYGRIITDLQVTTHIPAVQLAAEPAHAWARHAFIAPQVEGLTLDDISSDLRLYIKPTGTTEWTLASTADVTELKEYVKVTGLTAGTTYEFAASLDTTQDLTTLPVSLALTTESEITLPNAGMETWSSNKLDAKGNPITQNTKYVYWNRYFAYGAGDQSPIKWNTMNDKTTSHAATPTTGKYPFVGTKPKPPYVGCTYVTNSGTKPTDDKHTGSKAALIRSIGWGSGSAAASTAPKKADAGQLYLGSYNKSNHTPIYGVPFTSRPQGFTFYYKYAPKNAADKFIAKMVVLDANNKIIAQGQLPTAQCGKQAAYIKGTVKLNYQANVTTPAAKMYISFVSGIHVGLNDKDFSYPDFGNLSNGEFVGAQLWVDDIQLIY